MEGEVNIKLHVCVLSSTYKGNTCNQKRSKGIINTIVLMLGYKAVQTSMMRHVHIPGNVGSKGSVTCTVYIHVHLAERTALHLLSTCMYLVSRRSIIVD